VRKIQVFRYLVRSRPCTKRVVTAKPRSLDATPASLKKSFPSLRGKLGGLTAIPTSSQLDERLQHGSQPDFSLSRASLSALELDPAFVEAIKHLDAGYGVLHALRFE
jgi:hypothetical protein